MKTDTETKPEIQPKEPVNTLSIEPAAPLVKEKPKEPEGPGIEPATLPKVCPKPSSEHIALDLAPLLPSKSETEQVTPPLPKPQPETTNELKPPEAQESVANNEEPVFEAEKQLWATVEETTVETGADRVKDSPEKRQQEGGVSGG